MIQVRACDFNNDDGAFSQEVLNGSGLFNLFPFFKFRIEGLNRSLSFTQVMSTGEK